MKNRIALMMPATALFAATAHPAVLDLREVATSSEIYNNYGYLAHASDGYYLTADNIHSSAARNAGAVFVYDSATGGLLHTLTHPNPQPDQNLPSVYGGAQLTNNFVVVSDIVDDTLGQNAGAVLVYDAASGTYLRTLQAPDPGANTNFGWYLATHGDYALVGQRYNGVFVATDLTDAHEDRTKLTALYDLRTGNMVASFEAVQGGDLSALALTDKYAAITTRTVKSGDVTATPEVAVYDVASGSLLNVFTFPLDSSTHLRVDVDGDYLVIGGPASTVAGEPSAGAVSVFDIPSGNLLYRIDNPEPGLVEDFGYDVDADGSVLLVSAPKDDLTTGLNSNEGSLYLYELATGVMLDHFIDEFGFMGNIGRELALDTAAGIAVAGSLGRGLYVFDVNVPVVEEPDTDAVSDVPLPGVLPLLVGGWLMLLSMSRAHIGEPT